MLCVIVVIGVMRVIVGIVGIFRIGVIVVIRDIVLI